MPPAYPNAGLSRNLNEKITLPSRCVLKSGRWLGSHLLPDRFTEWTGFRYRTLIPYLAKRAVTLERAYVAGRKAGRHPSGGGNRFIRGGGCRSLQEVLQRYNGAAAIYYFVKLIM
jgi:hypothetical protein